MIDRPQAVKDGSAFATFDFDETITLPEWDSHSLTWRRTLNPNWYTINEMCRLMCRGWDVSILTERKKSPLNVREIKHFLTKHAVPIKRVAYTDGNEKHLFLKEIRSILHYDDDLYELMNLPEEVTGIQILHPEDRHLAYKAYQGDVLGLTTYNVAMTPDAIKCMCHADSVYPAQALR